MIQEEDESPSTTTSPLQHGDAEHAKTANGSTDAPGIIQRIAALFKPKHDPSLRETIEEYIDGDLQETESEPFSDHEKTLLSNVLDLHDMSATDIMIPRADIVGIPHDITQDELLEALSEKQYSRFPIYKGTLDNILGSVHIKDILAGIARDEQIILKDLQRDIPIISPSMHILDLLLQMRITRKHMVLVVDEFGGIDGLITIGDVIEAIVGEIDDEHDPEDNPEISTQTDGTILADARVDLDEFEEEFGRILSDEERQENDTLGGLVFFLAGRVPARGEVIKHDTGMVFEILEAGPRRVNKLCIRNIPARLVEPKK